MWLDLSRVSGELFRLERNRQVKLYIPAAWVAQNASIHIETDRHLTTRDLERHEWVKSPATWASRADLHVPFTPRKNGSYKFCVVNDEDTVFANGYLCVKAQLASTAPVTKLESVIVQTVVPKLMGTIDQWDDVVEHALACHYNMLHFTPLQELGWSNSAYCIKDQLQVDQRYGASNEEMGAFMSKLRDQHNILACTDLVFNHMASDATWIKEHPEATFNLVNSPHLIPAFLLDRELIHINREIVAGNHPEVANITDEAQLALLGRLIRERLIMLNLAEYRQCDVEAEIERFKHIKRQSTESTNLKLVDEIQSERLTRRANLETYSGTVESLRATLIWLNRIEHDKMIEIINCALNGILGTVRYERLEGSGPQKGPFSVANPICTKYFECNIDYTNTVEILSSESKKAQVAAHNGWVLDWDPMVCFMSPRFDTYLKRALVPWDDCVKLNYGSSSASCPPLWLRMAEYATWAGTHFDAIRIDNCHSTPLHVAEYFLQVARHVNPHLIVIAELFTSSKQSDDLFVSRLGLDCLIRESLQAAQTHRFAYRDGITAFCGLDVDQVDSTGQIKSSLAGACLVDITHDNAPSTIERHGVADCLPRAAICAMSNAAIGSARGYDELVKEHINIVTERRQYEPKDQIGSNFAACKSALNALHVKLAETGHDRCEYEIKDRVVVIRRRNYSTGSEYICLAHTQLDSDGQNALIELDTQLEKLTVEQYMSIDKNEEIAASSDSPYITGLRNQFTIDIDQAKVKFHDQVARIILPVGAVLIISGSFTPPSISLDDVSGAIDTMTLTELNQTLFSCEKEERANTGHGCYDVPHHGVLPYAGFGGVYQLMERVFARRDSHPLVDNVKHGTWLLEYLINRAEHGQLKITLHAAFDQLKKNLTFTNRAYYSLIFLRDVTEQLINRVMSLHPAWLTQTHYGRLSALSLCALFGRAQGAHWPLSPTSSYYQIGSLCAGLPHFAEGIWRCWGRDTLISLRGALILTGRLDEAKAGLIAFGSTLRHGLIPNLLGEGKVSRYNCRDATWFWLNSACDLYAAGDVAIFDELVPHGFVTDEAEFDFDGPKRTVEAVIYDILDRHGAGIEFRERNAGPAIDMNMDER